MAEDIVSVYNKGDTSESICLCKLYNETTSVYDLTDADALYPKCTISDPNGTVLITAQPMTKLSTGKYVYRYNIATTAAVGWYPVKHDISITSGGATRLETQYTGFTVV
jgi:hypothetical protein